jgi:hypothetical protein
MVSQKLSDRIVTSTLRQRAAALTQARQYGGEQVQLVFHLLDSHIQLIGCHNSHQPRLVLLSPDRLPLPASAERSIASGFPHSASKPGFESWAHLAAKFALPAQPSGPLPNSMSAVSTCHVCVIYFTMNPTYSHPNILFPAPHPLPPFPGQAELSKNVKQTNKPINLHPTNATGTARHSTK